MKGSLVLLLCATAACCVYASPIPAEEAVAESTDVTQIQATGSQGVDSVDHESSAIPVLPASHKHQKPSGRNINHKYGEKIPTDSHGEGAVNHLTVGNPFLRGAQQRQFPGTDIVSHVQVPGGFVNQQFGGTPTVGAPVQGVHVGSQAGGNPFLQGTQQQQHIPGTGHVHPVQVGFGSQNGVTPVGSHVQVPGGFVNQQIGATPPGSHAPTSGGFVNQQIGGKPPGSHVPTSGVFVNQQLGVTTPVGSNVPTSGGFGGQQIGVAAPVGSHVPTVTNPFLQGSSVHHVGQQPAVQSVGSLVHPSGGQVGNQQTPVNPFLSGYSVHRHVTPSGGHQKQKLGNQHAGAEHQVAGQQQGVQAVRTVGSHVHPTGVVQQVGSHVHPAVGAKPGGSDVTVHPIGGVQSVGSHIHVHPTSEVVTQQPEVQTVVEHHQGVVATARKISGYVAEDSHHEKPVIQIISQDSEVNPDGSHHNVWESENGIKVQEEGTVKFIGEDAVHTVSGSIAYTDADGNPIVLTYTADENGFHPHGDHLPTPPPIPQSVARALEYIAAHPYDEEKDAEVARTTTTVVKEELPVIEVN